MSAVPREAPLTASETGRLLRVSRETVERLQLYLDLLARWQSTINLVGAATLVDPWRRHILDCGQLWAFWPEGGRRLVDLGSGAGLPGLVLGILGAPEVHLIESDRRKAAFLREAARATGSPATVHACRIGAAPALAADVLSSRALAPLDELLALGRPFIGPSTLCLFPKGRNAPAELARARQHWRMQAELLPSLSDRDGAILALREVARA